jgi:3D-(3,5/4)-trihydroxycyclohexane-1,2-dione acylhydrolase (decyclizing)
MVGDGSYLMLNSEIATSVRLGARLIIVLLDNGGFGCIERLQGATGNASFNNLLPGAHGAGRLDLVAHARSLGAHASRVRDLAGLAAALAAARKADRTAVLVIETDPAASTTAGGHWWDVAVPEVSGRAEVRAARERYESARRLRTDDG